MLDALVYATIHVHGQGDVAAFKHNMLAHEDHHTHTNIPLWQIITTGGVARAIYIGLTAWRNRRTNRN